MLIGIDGNEANIEQKVGVHQYAYEILWGLYKLHKKLDKKHNFVIYLKRRPSKELPTENSWWRYKVLPGKGLWIVTKLMPYLLFTKERPEVFFSPSHYLPPVTLMPKICTIHDLGYLEFSGQFKKLDFWQLKVWTAISLSISKYIISVSNSVKKNIVRHYPSTSDKIEITLHGYDKNRFNSNIKSSDVRRVKRKYGINKYILFLSTLKPSKNIEGLIDAFSILDEKNKVQEYQLVIAGKKGWLFESIFEKVKQLRLGNRIVFTDFIEEIDKPALLKGAEVFASPSYWEGFGIHVLEAMAVGTPVVISDIASLPEVGGSVAVYVDPMDVNSIARGIEKVLFMPEKEYNKLVLSTIEQAKKFSWEKAAKKTYKLLTKA